MQNLKLGELITQIDKVRSSLHSQPDDAFNNDNDNKKLAFALFDNGDGDTQFAQQDLGSKASVVDAINTFMSALRTQSTTAQVDAALQAVKRNIDAITNVKQDGVFPDNYESQQLKGKTFYDLLIAARDNYIKQLEAYNKVKNLQESALEVTPYLHPKKNLARSIVSAVVGATVTGAVTYWLHNAFTDTIAGHDFIPGTPAVDFKPAVPGTSAVPGIPAVSASVRVESDGTIITTQGTPAVPAQPAVADIPAVEARNATPDQPSTDATTEAPNGSEITLIVLVGIIMLAITAYIVHHYLSRYKEDKDLDPSSNKNLLNIAGIDNKSISQIKTQMNEVALADFNIKKRLQNPEQPSLIQAF